MTLAEIREKPKTLTRLKIEAALSTGMCGMHESLLRSYAVLEKVRELLMADQPTPPKVILEIIDDLMDAPDNFK